ncbi:MAG: hypothetical protein JXR59_04470 [Desulfuromonadaceae bacterium]|nr:hypothetical protein [Desulfuromonadaceae bacterium]
MTPQSVQHAWIELPEAKKVTVIRACAKQQPYIFLRWKEAAGLKNFRPDSIVNRKAGAGARLDAVLFNAEEGHLAAELLISYFTAMNKEINEDYLAMIKGAGNEELATKLDIYAKLAVEYADSPYIKLYLATALWVGEIDEKELETIEKLAVELR